ncbi:MAG TPA: glutamate racemase [bacterium]|nr:glutamate racemase [bacterium]
MKNAIGIFDSGLGGLTVLKELKQMLPDEDIIYVADTIHIPYGNKSVQEIVCYMKQIVLFLEKMDVKAVIVACNTSSALALKYIENIISTPIIGLIEPTAEKLSRKESIRKVGVLATRATVSSLAYTLAIRRYNPQIQVIERSAPLLVSLIENRAKKDMLFKALSVYLGPLIEAQIDTLILGCSHYPLYLKEISSILLEKGSDIEIVDPARPAVEKLALILRDTGIIGGGRGDIEFYTTGDAYDFKEKASIFWNGPVKVRHINLREVGEIKLWQR